ncbi:DUF3054 domain-containing protein [Micropruina sonneratiae]|uniref:DUF3054 domain-containing protein n=1 Tax=Micropruina sonneratiae TaxID=2986940 RepID=UPI002227E171|nr:DUF3054 domain-containing protein [Micropruina sp. KQZ13P-5]MCW3157702.1 DUF3054 domain-containing protein [Micropruina sp. KQZ13P-5]
MTWWKAFGIDLLVVLLFATIGRLSHGEAADPAGIALTAWPFLIALLGLTVAMIGMKRPTDSLLNGALIWAGTLAFGMWIRHESGGGVEVGFVIVAGAFLALGMLGWRLIAGRRRRASA